MAPDDEACWAEVRLHYAPSPRFVNLEHGQFGICAAPVHQALQRYQDQIRQEGAYFVRERFPPLHKEVLGALAAFTGAAAEELLITRNLTDSLRILLHGYPFERGDGIVLAEHDFHGIVAMVEALGQAKALQLTRVPVPLEPDSDEQIVDLYERRITPRTRLILVTHLVHSTGQIMPVARIAAMARRRGIDVMVDAAHSFAQLDFQFASLGADFIGVNLHKWLGAPLGAGLLYIRRPRIADITPAFGGVGAQDDIGKLGNLGILPPAPILAVRDALEFHLAIGARNKENRLRYLTQYWLARVRALPRLRQLTPRDVDRSCAIAALSIDGLPAETVATRLMAEHGIFTVARKIGAGAGVRVSAHLSTTPAQLDRLVEALVHITQGSA